MTRAQGRYCKALAGALLLIIFSSTALRSQDRDSLRVYKKIKKAANRFRLTKLAYDAVFVDPDPREYPVQPAAPKEEKHVNPYMLYPGRIIRKINITVLDPFGRSINDTTRRSVNWVQKLGNSAHVTTRRWIILNRLLFRENDTVNPLAFSETERVIRAFVFVNDARVFISPTPSRDSVDVNVVVHDKWPITVPLMITDMAANARVRNSNFFGLGQQFEHYAGYNRPGRYDINGFYNIANIDRTFISSRLAYQHTNDYTNTNLSFDRPFYSPLAKWAAGLNLGHTWRRHEYFDSTRMIDRHVPLNLASYDVYAAKSFKFAKSGSLFNQSTNLILGLRHYNNIFVNRPGRDIDSARTHRHWGAVIGNVGFAIQQYYKDKYIYRFGANEDVPEGLIMQFIYGGWRREYDKVRYYKGFEIARAKHFSFGYTSATVSYGIFYNTNVPNDVTTNFRLNYFSELLRTGSWYFRQFVNYAFVHGDNKLSGERITLRPEEMYGFDNNTLTGNTKMLLNLESVAYMPYNLIGFRFAPILMVGLGMVGDKELPLFKSRLFQGYSLGILMRNENLLSSTFHVSFGFYPYLPDGRKNVFVYNPVGSFTLRVRGFSIGRPDFVSYY